MAPRPRIQPSVDTPIASGGACSRASTKSSSGGAARPSSGSVIVRLETSKAMATCAVPPRSHAAGRPNSTNSVLFRNTHDRTCSSVPRSKADRQASPVSISTVPPGCTTVAARTTTALRTVDRGRGHSICSLAPPWRSASAAAKAFAAAADDGKGCAWSAVSQRMLSATAKRTVAERATRRSSSPVVAVAKTSWSPGSRLASHASLRPRMQVVFGFPPPATRTT
mmetsp:Transcript_26304/g.90789  ORF Transcript_26304/g.90789 Transcript_26304/m.90789 type:complete len:224 (-) Transcript_26304:262-933(-)